MEHIYILLYKDIYFPRHTQIKVGSWNEHTGVRNVIDTFLFKVKSYDDLTQKIFTVFYNLIESKTSY